MHNNSINYFYVCLVDYLPVGSWGGGDGGGRGKEGDGDVGPAGLDPQPRARPPGPDPQPRPAPALLIVARRVSGKIIFIHLIFFNAFFRLPKDSEGSRQLKKVPSYGP